VSAPIERTIRYATSVEELTDAWKFIMDKIDEVGPNPSIAINPRWITPVSAMNDDDYVSRREFEVTVSGMVPVADVGGQ